MVAAVQLEIKVKDLKTGQSVRVTVPFIYTESPDNKFSFNNVRIDHSFDPTYVLNGADFSLEEKKMARNALDRGQKTLELEDAALGAVKCQITRTDGGSKSFQMLVPVPVRIPHDKRDPDISFIDLAAGRHRAQLIDSDGKWQAFDLVYRQC